MNNEEKAPSDANKRGKGFGSRNTFWREAFAGTSEAMNALQVKFVCREGNEGGAIFGIPTIDNSIPDHEV